MMTEEVLRTDPADTSAEVSGTPTNRRGLEVYGIPAISLKETLHDLEVIHRGTTGECCPRCGEKEFGKLGNYIYKGKTRPKRLCRSCGYVFSLVDPHTDGYTGHRAARLFNLDKQKAYNIFDDSLQYGIIKENNDGTFSKATIHGVSKSEMYHKIPIYHYLIEAVGYNLQRHIFENALQTHPEKTIATISKIKRDTLWRRYQEIAVEIFVCEKTCKFSRTCKKDHIERNKCDIVQNTKPKKTVWRADIEL